MLPPTEEGIAAAAKRIQDDKLVSFPTETVFGLGANALSEDAVSSIFRAKKRPQNNPLIVHVSEKKYALPLGVFKKNEYELFDLLADRFWPGPLTLVVKASCLVPHAVTAGTGFVGLRCPNNPTALALLRACGMPVAAPSANLSGAVSPTTADHVMSEFVDGDVAVIGGAVSCCEHGIESTVAKIDGSRCTVTILREGSVTRTDILDSMNYDQRDIWEVVSEPKYVSVSPMSVGEQSPGQGVAHYSPALSCYIVSSLKVLSSGDSVDMAEPIDSDALSTAVVIDFGGRLVSLKDYVLAYQDLSPNSDPSEAARNLFATIRWADKVINGTVIMLADPSRSEDGSRDIVTDAMFAETIAPALMDRMFRAAAGTKRNICIEQRNL
ncbi:unnamed protein product [Ectocarpus fasciculatus]